MPLPPGDGDRPDVGDFEQGTPASRWAMARYLVGRAIGEDISLGLTILALAVIAVGGLVYWSGPTWLAVLIWLFALCALLMRWALGVVLRRFTGVGTFGPMEDRMRRLVADTRGDVRAELRRIGLPGRTWTLPLLAVRLVRPARRVRTLNQLRTFDIDRAVPRSRLDELHLIVRHLRAQ
jgi:hypothetical protein